MGPRALKVLSMCLWSCVKQPSLQNLTRLTQPLLPVWGISSKLRTRPSTPLFLTPAPWAPFRASNFPSATVSAAVIHRAFCGAVPNKNTFLDPWVPCDLAHVVTRIDMLLMVQTRCVHRFQAELWHPSFVVGSAGLINPLLPSEPRILECALSLWWTDRSWWFMDLSVGVQEKHNRARMSGWTKTPTHTHTNTM